MDGLLRKYVLTERGATFIRDGLSIISDLDEYGISEDVFLNSSGGNRRLGLLRYLLCSIENKNISPFNISNSKVPAETFFLTDEDLESDSNDGEIDIDKIIQEGVEEGYIDIVDEVEDMIKTIQKALALFNLALRLSHGDKGTVGEYPMAQTIRDISPGPFYELDNKLRAFEMSLVKDTSGISTHDRAKNIVLFIMEYLS